MTGKINCSTAAPATTRPLSAGVGSGACSSTACTLVPDMPYEETAARRGATLSSTGQPVVSWGTNNPVSILAR